MNSNGKNNETNKWTDQEWLTMSTDIVSATEVTGMALTPPLNEGEVEGYQDLLRMPQKVACAAQKADTPRERGKQKN